VRRLALAPLALALVALAGCSAYMPTDDDPVHMRIQWRNDFDQARRDAQTSGKPILLVLAAGDLQKVC
jgi:hypothetical protein